MAFTDAMRAEVERVVRAVGEMLEKRLMSPPVNDKRCEHCSLRESCLPPVVAERERSRKAVRGLFSIEVAVGQ